jgi:hypothetical protein
MASVELSTSQRKSIGAAECLVRNSKSWVVLENGRVVASGPAAKLAARDGASDFYLGARPVTPAYGASAGSASPPNDRKGSDEGTPSVGASGAPSGNGPGITAAASEAEDCAGADHGAGGEAGTAVEPAAAPPVTPEKKAFARRSSAAGSGMKVQAGPVDILAGVGSIRRVSRRDGCNRGSAQSPHHRAPRAHPRSRRRANNKAR